jgi:hypothetical protein
MLSVATDCGAQNVGPREIPPAIGPYINLRPDAVAGAHTFRSSDKIVMTHDFYWYDVGTNSRILSSDGTDALITHPGTMQDFSYKPVAWHKQQLIDIIKAGIDVVLPVPD